MLTLSLEATHGEADESIVEVLKWSVCAQSAQSVTDVEMCRCEVGIAPHPDDLKQKILDLINDVTKAQIEV